MIFDLRHSQGRLRSQAGYTLVELLVSIFISSLLLAMVLGTLVTTTSYYHDRAVKAEADEAARVLLDLVAYDLRMAGAGIPFNQTDFQIADAGLGDAPLPLLLSSDADSITIRFSEDGKGSVLTTNFTPSVFNLEFDVFSSDPFVAGDIVYLSNAVTGGRQGLRAEVAAVDENTITLVDDYVTTVGASFPAGSFIHRVSTITYDGSSDLSRSDGTDTITLLPGSRLALQYFAESGAELTPTLTEAQVRNELSRVRITVRVASDTKLKDGSTYTATATQDVSLRNLILSRL